MRPVTGDLTKERVTIPSAVGELAVHQCGIGSQTIVLWPSIFTDHQIYDRLVARLSDRVRFVLIDGPGHGSSGGPGRICSGAEFGQGMIDVMNALDIERAVVGGTSWGGLVGAEVATTAADRVDALLLMNTPMNLDRRRPGLKSRAIAFGARWMLQTQLFRDGVAKSFFADETLKRSSSAMEAFHEMLSAADPRELSLAVRSVLLEGEPLMERLERISVPTLVIAGMDDEMYPLPTQVEAGLRVPKGQFQAVEGRHISVVDAPNTVAQTLWKFLVQEVNA